MERGGMKVKGMQAEIEYDACEGRYKRGAERKRWRLPARPVTIVRVLSDEVNCDALKIIVSVYVCWQVWVEMWPTRCRAVVSLFMEEDTRRP